MNYSALIKPLLLGLLWFFLGWSVHGYVVSFRDSREASNVEKNLNNQINSLVSEIEARDHKVTTLQNKLSSQSSQDAKALDEKLAENAALRTDLSVLQRMRLHGTTCPAQTHVVSAESTTSGSVGDAAEVELSPATQQLVFNLRQSIIADQSKIDYLQHYIEGLELAPK